MEPRDLRTGAIIQARMGSTRLPGKSMRRIVGKPVLQHVMERVRLSELGEHVYVATSSGEEDDAIAEFCREISVGVFRGSESNVLERFHRTARHFNLSRIVRITGDSPLIGPDVIDFMLDTHRGNGNDLTTGYHSKSFPAGTVVSVLDFDVLDFLAREAESLDVKEHIITDLELIGAKLQVEVVQAPERWLRSDLRYEVDYEEDFEVASRIIEHFAALGVQPSTTEIIGFLDDHPEIRGLNAEYVERAY